MFIIYLYITLFSQITFSNNFIVIPFNSDKLKRTKDFKFNDTDFFIEKDILFTLMYLGNDIIELYLTNDYYNFFLGNGLCRKDSLSTYNPSNSNNFKNLTNYIYPISYINNASYSSDKCLLYKDLNLKEYISLDNLNFLYGNNTFKKNIFNDEQICGFIGLHTESKEETHKDYNFIKVLKRNKIITSYTWSIIFFNKYNLNNNELINENIINKYEGLLLCGIEENDIKTIFSTEDIRNTMAKPKYSLIDWGIIFNEIYFGNKNKTEMTNYQNSVHVIFNIDLNYIICNDYFFKHLYKTLFKEYFDKNICSFNEKEKIKENYVIECDKSFEKYINDFPDLYFYHKELNYTFILSNHDLFQYFGDKIYFLIINKIYYTDYWSLGNIFLKKYPFIFDYDKKMISFINIYTEDKNQKKNYKEFKNKFKYFWNITKNISIIFGVIIGILIAKKIWDKSRKKRTNELIDSFVYESNNNRNEKKKLELKDKILFFENN